MNTKYYTKRIKALNILSDNNLKYILEQNNCTLFDLEICHYNNNGSTHRKFLTELYNIKYPSTFSKTVDFILQYPKYSKRLMFVDTKRNNLLESIEISERKNKQKYQENKETIDSLLNQ